MKNILIGVTGSIAAYKAVYLVRLFVENKYDVKVVMTEAATKFVSPLTFTTLSKNNIYLNLWESNESWVQHVELSEWADLFIIAPATAHTIFKIAHGACDNFITAIYLSVNCPVFISPAMDLNMYAHFQTSQNINKIKQSGVYVIEPEEGFLASGLYGKGRMAEPEKIYSNVVSFINRKQILKNKNVLITAGPTREYIDSVRYISNESSGKMGIALAYQASELGANVDFCLGPTEESVSNIKAHIHRFISADDLLDLVKDLYKNMDIIIMVAAVADYKPIHKNEIKLKKQDDQLVLKLDKTVDILQFLGDNKQKDQKLIGFALEDHNELENAKNKLIKKKLDLIILNSINDEGAGFNTSTNKVKIINKKLEIYDVPLLLKSEVAYIILEKISQLSI